MEKRIRKRKGGQERRNGGRERREEYVGEGEKQKGEKRKVKEIKCAIPEDSQRSSCVFVIACDISLRPH